MTSVPVSVSEHGPSIEDFVSFVKSASRRKQLKQKKPSSAPSTPASPAALSYPPYFVAADQTLPEAEPTTKMISDTDGESGGEQSDSSPTIMNKLSAKRKPTLVQRSPANVKRKATVTWYYPTPTGSVLAPRWGHAAAVVGSKLYILGGTGNKVYGECYTFDLGESPLLQLN